MSRGILSIQKRLTIAPADIFFTASCGIRDLLVAGIFNVTHKSIFELYAKLNKSKNDMLDYCYEYATTPQKWWKFCEHIDAVQKEFDNFSYHYAESMEVNEKEVSFPISSAFIDNGNYDYIGDWVWKHKEDKFAFDSESEKEWAYILKGIAEDVPKLVEIRAA